MNIIFATLLFLPFLANLSPTCDCLESPPFMAVESDADLVVEVTVERLGGYLSAAEGGVPKVSSARYMDVQIRNVLRGNEAKGNIIRIYGDDGASCRPYVSTFRSHEKWIMALHYVGTKKNRHGRAIINEYSISSCGEYWLKVKGKRVMGRITGSERESPSGDTSINMAVPISQMDRIDFYVFYRAVIKGNPLN